MHLSQTLLNFNQINAGESSGRVIDIVNDSNCDAAYQVNLKAKLLEFSVSLHS